MSAEAAIAETRRYRKRLRAEQEQQTRQAITEAAVRLHGTLGPARTTVSAIAEEAGVQRATVYRHFPDEPSLFQACSGHYMAMHPPPDPTRWMEIADPAERLREALADVYELLGDLHVAEHLEVLHRHRVAMVVVGDDVGLGLQRLALSHGLHDRGSLAAQGAG